MIRCPMGRILIVDDTLFMRTLLKNILFSGGHTIVGEAADGEEGIAKYKELKPDLVTMDVVMPKMNGIESLKGIRQFDPGAKVIMCTAVGQEQMVKLAIKTGAKGYIVKPFQAPKVLEEVKNVLAS
jgi:two-component system chemotaxis response regulator CheY